MLRVYIETTIPSYLAAQPSRDVVLAGKQETTREWWARYGQKLDLFTSTVCLEEASQGDPEAARKRLEVLETLPLLEMTESVESVAGQLVESGLIPHKCARDAFHIAFATVHDLDVLLTWNCAHLANAFMLRDMAKKLRELGYEPPVICTPEEMMGDDDG